MPPKKKKKIQKDEDLESLGIYEDDEENEDQDEKESWRDIG